MSKTPELIHAELSNLSIVVSELTKIKKIPDKINLVRITGIAGLLQNFYNGVENILKIMMKDKNIQLPQGPSWHRELILLSSSKGLLSEKLVDELEDYLSFRHLVIHAYAVDLNPQKMMPLIKNINKVFNIFKKELQEKFKQN